MDKKLIKEILKAFMFGLFGIITLPFWIPFFLILAMGIQVEKFFNGELF